MSKATSLRGKKFEANFIAGFLRQNDHLIGQHFSGIEVKSISSHNKVGDVDFFVKLRAGIDNIVLEDVMPLGASLHERGFVLQAEDNIFFELTTQEGNNIHQAHGAKPSYIEKKVEFHSKIQRGETDFLYPDNGNKATTGRNVLILVFNGADSAKVYPAFQSSMSSHRGLLVGSSVFASSDLISQWELSLQLQEAERAREAADRAREAADRAREAAERLAVEERAARLALEEEVKRLLADRK